MSKVKLSLTGIKSNIGKSIPTGHVYYIVIDCPEKNRLIATMPPKSRFPKIVVTRSSPRNMKKYLALLRESKIVTIEEECTETNWVYLELKNIQAT